MSTRLVCRYVCRCANVVGSGTERGTTGSVRALLDRFDCRAGARTESLVQYAASTRVLVG